MSEWAAKRFWEKTEVAACAGGFEVLLDGRRVKTPAKSALVLPTRVMAEAVAGEWQAQVKTIDPRTMPVTASANAALDKVTVQKDEVVALLAAYGDSDLLCYRAASPEGLVARQNAAWDPLLDWADQALKARLSTVVGVMHEAQDPTALQRLHGAVARHSVFELTALHDLVALSGSLVIGLAAMAKAWPIDALWAASRVDETWQEDQWGPDEEAAEMAERKRQAFLHAERFVGLLESQN